MSKFASLTDEYLYRLTLDGTSDNSGDVAAPTGWFAAIVLPPGTPLDPEITKDIALNAPLSGFFLLREDEQGFVSVTSYGSETELTSAYEKLESEYGDWASED